jgi:hypothetical protein
VCHHLAPDTKTLALAEIKRMLRADGRLVIADYGSPVDPLMRLAFSFVQLLDGLQTTRQHIAGQLPDLIAQAGFDVSTIDRLRTMTGTLESSPPCRAQLRRRLCSVGRTSAGSRRVSASPASSCGRPHGRRRV